MTAPTRSPARTLSNEVIAHDLVVDHHSGERLVRALDCAELAVEGGTSLAVMGPSGCGKSTLLGLLGTLAGPTRGTISVGDTMITSLTPKERVRFRRRSLGMVYQADNLLPHLTVEEQVGLQLSICRNDRRDDSAADIPGVLERLGLLALAARLPDQLSGGERQRVAVARAVIHRPRVILADEPTGSLDDERARIVIELLVGAQREIGATLIVVTHDPAVAARLDRTVHLERPTMEPHDAC